MDQRRTGLWITDDTWATLVTNVQRLTLILFVEPASAPCLRAYATVGQRLLACDDAPDLYRYDLWSSSSVALSLRISIAPTLVAFRGRQKVYEHICQPTAEGLDSLLTGSSVR